MRKVISLNRAGLFTSLLVLFLFFASPLQSAQTRGFSIVGTGDLAGMLFPFAAQPGGEGEASGKTRGGLAELGGLIKRIKAENPGSVIAVSSGDDLMNKYCQALGGAAVYTAMRTAGYDLFALGNHEFDRGTKQLAEALRSSRISCLDSDLQTDSTDLSGLCQPYRIVELGGVKVGLFSLMVESLPYVTDAGQVRLKADNIVSARRLVAELRSAGAEVVVGLTHVGLERDLEIAAQVPGIDVIFGGHSHGYTAKPQLSGQTLVVNGGEQGVYLLRLDLKLDANGRLDLNNYNFDLLAVTSEVKPDAQTAELLENYKKSLPAEIIVGNTASAWDLTSQNLRQGKSDFAAFYAGLMRERFAADLALLNAGSLRGGKLYQPGPVSDERLREINQFNNNVCLVSLSGEDLAQVLERSAASFGQGGLLYPSGLRYEIDLNAEPQILETTKDGLKVERPGQRVKNVEVLSGQGAWQKLDPRKTYRVASNDYMVLRQGDGYFWFKLDGQSIENTYVSIYSLLADRLSKENPLNIPSGGTGIKIGGAQ